MRTNIVLDDELVAEAFKYVKVKTKRELVNLALRELVARHRRKNLLELFGTGGILDDYDYKEMRDSDRGA